MNEELKKFLSKCGFPEDVVTQFEEIDKDNPPDIETLASEYKQAQREVYENDPDFIKNLQSQMRGKERGSVERKIMKVFGISAEDAREHGLENDYEKLLAYGKEYIEKNSSKTAKEIQAELQQANLTIKEYKDKIIPEIEEKAKGRINEFYVQNHLGRLIDGAGELIVKQKAATKLLAEELKSRGYKVTLNDDGSDIDIKTKDGLAPQNKEKTRNLTKEELVKGIFEEEGLLKQSRAGDPPPTPGPRPTPDPVRDDVHRLIPHLAEAEKNISNPRRVKGGLEQFQK